MAQDQVIEIENQIEDRIAQLGDDTLMQLWLNRLSLKNIEAEQRLTLMERNKPIIVGAIIGAAIARMITDEQK